MTTELSHRLVIEPCTREAASFAVNNWHYARSMPGGRLNLFGVWEDERFIGAIVFGHGANRRLGSRWDLGTTEVIELIRVALRDHETETSAIVMRACRVVHARNPGVRMIVSYADEGRGHIGVMYQAANWIYVGSSHKTKVMIHGEPVHNRTISGLYGTRKIAWLREHVDPKAVEVKIPARHCYVLPLDRAMRRRVLRSALPYPRSRAQREPPVHQTGEAGSIPADRSTA